MLEDGPTVERVAAVACFKSGVRLRRMEWREQIERWGVKIGQYRIAKVLCSQF